MYQVKIKNKSYNLPTKTIEVLTKIEKLSLLDNRLRTGEINAERSVTEQYEFICDCIGTENAAEIFNSDNIYDIDTDEILSAAIEIIKAYTANAVKIKNDIAIGNCKELINNPSVKKVVDIVNSIKNA